DSPTWYYDIDEDGYGSTFIIALECEAPLGYVSSNTDCDDTKPTVYPGATEYCNNLDNDCNGDIDDNAVDAFYWYADLDRDDFGDATDSIYQCDQPFSYILDANDCDDGDSDIHPDAEELCNGRDDNCDGAVDNDTIDFLVYYLDADEDGFGDPNTEIEDCELPSGYVIDNTDCNDTDALIHPDAEEDCDGVDQNCSGMNFYEQDLNSDGELACETSRWVRNNFANNTSPYSASSESADLLLSMGITISEAYHAHTSINQALLENTGLYIHHGRNSNGAIGAYTNAEANAIRTWVYDGGRMLYIGYDSSHGACEIADSLPSQFGVSCDPNYIGWSGSSTSFAAHSITSGLTEIGGNGGDNWVVSAPAETLVSVNGNPFVVVSEYGDGKVVIVSNQWPYLNSGSGYRINFADNQVLVGNIWQWLLD
ncbi:MAG: putative metal-binding motif-containing protein, partial [Myxococcota bacterium]|nr:putative metal-binding motif-containing protein [Myxococcota bacterium]